MMLMDSICAFQAWCVGSNPTVRTMKEKEKNDAPGIHPDFGRWIDGKISEEEYADSLAARVEEAMKEKK